jgi:hypothetical protein
LELVVKAYREQSFWQTKRGAAKKRVHALAALAAYESRTGRPESLEISLRTIKALGEQHRIDVSRYTTERADLMKSAHKKAAEIYGQAAESTQSELITREANGQQYRLAPINQKGREWVD